MFLCPIILPSSTNFQQLLPVLNNFYTTFISFYQLLPISNNLNFFYQLLTTFALVLSTFNTKNQHFLDITASYHFLMLLLPTFATFYYLPLTFITICQCLTSFCPAFTISHQFCDTNASSKNICRYNSSPSFITHIVDF